MTVLQCAGHKTLQHHAIHSLAYDLASLLRRCLHHPALALLQLLTQAQSAVGLYWSPQIT